MTEGLPSLNSNLSTQTMKEKQDWYAGMVLVEQLQQLHLADLYAGMQLQPLMSLQDKYCAVLVGGGNGHRDAELGSIITGTFMVGNHGGAPRLTELRAFTTAKAVQGFRQRTATEDHRPPSHQGGAGVPIVIVTMWFRGSSKCSSNRTIMLVLSSSPP